MNDVNRHCDLLTSLTALESLVIHSHEFQDAMPSRWDYAAVDNPVLEWNPRNGELEKVRGAILPTDPEDSDEVVDVGDTEDEDEVESEGKTGDGEEVESGEEVENSDRVESGEESESVEEMESAEEMGDAETESAKETHDEGVNEVQKETESMQ